MEIANIKTKEDVLRYFEQTGNTCISIEDCQENTLLSSMLAAGSLWTRDGYATLPYIMKVEKEIAERVIQLRDYKGSFPAVSHEDIDRMIAEFEALQTEQKGFKFKLADQQAEAVHGALTNQVFILTGGPGTGKTCVLDCMNSILRKIKPDAEIIFTAPTGKAARRITESVGEPASTIQKKMHLTDETAQPLPIYGDCIIVDEISMLDTLTADAFFMAVRLGVKVILVGDVDQLPSVGYGSVLKDLIESSELAITKLLAPQRQDASSVLFQNITNLKNGMAELFQGDDFKIVHADDKTGLDTLITEYFRSVDKWGIDNVCCLTPYRRKGPSCANVMNDIIQKRINDPDKTPHLTTTITEDDDELSKCSSRRITFCLGDPVIQLVNRNEIANGDVGKIIEVDQNSITVKYEGDIIVEYRKSELDQLNLAYAMSVHKSQGSEYKCVVTSALPEHKRLLCRNMLYTAVTRAKKDCVVVCDQATVEEGLKRQAGYERETLLSSFIWHEGRKGKLLAKLKIA